MKLKERILSLLNYFKIIWRLRKILFKDKETMDILKMIKLFIEIEAPLYKKSIIMGRSIKKSSELLGVLIDSYYESKSEIILNQIMTILKEEFIKREQGNWQKTILERIG